MLIDRQSKAIVRAVLALGKSLDIPVLAEGIETGDQISILRTEGCDEGQGFLLGRPSPAGDLASQGGPVRTSRKPRQQGSLLESDRPEDAAAVNAVSSPTRKAASS